MHKTISAASVALLVFSSVLLTGCDSVVTIGNQTAEPVPPKSTKNNQVNMIQESKPTKGDKVAFIETNVGTIKVKLFPEQTPETVKNFEELAKAGKYKDVIFHRVISDFMIQTGDFENHNGTGGYSYKGEGTKINDEFHNDLSHIKGALSMANAGPNTNGSQFFIVQAEQTSWLDGKHSVFGQTYEGIDIVDQIAGVATGVGDKPVEDIVIKNIEVTTF